MIKTRFSLQWIIPIVAGVSALSCLSLAHASNYAANGGKLAIVNKASSELTVLNLNDQTRQTFSLGSYLPHETAVAQNFIFVSNYGSAYIRSSAVNDKPGNTLSVIDLSQPKKHPQTIDLGPGRCGPHGLAVSSNQEHLYITCEVRQEILELDVATQTVIDSFPTNQAGSHLLVLNSDESKAFVGNFFHGTISVIDLKNHKILDQIKVDYGSEGIGISPDDKYLYVTSPISSVLIKIDVETHKEVARQWLGTSYGSGYGPLRVVPTPDTGDELVINCSDNDSVFILDAKTLKIKKEISVGHQPIGIAVANSSYAYSANMEDGTVSVINLESKTVEATLAAGKVPDGMFYFN